MSLWKLLRSPPPALALAGILSCAGCSSGSGGPVEPAPLAEILLEKQGSLDLGGDGEANPGDLISYTFDVTNTGDATLTGVSVFDLSVPDLDCGDGTNSVGTLASGEMAQCSGTYAITLADVDAGQRVNTAVVEGTDPDGEPVSDNDTHTEAVPFVALPITGEYAIEVQVVSDGCDFGASGGNLVMDVLEQGSDAAEVDVPIGGAGGICDPRSFVRLANTLTRTRTSESQSGDCLLEAVVTTVFEFDDNDTVEGSETNRYSEAGGDCSLLDLPCEISLSATGARCSGCYDCTVAARGRSGAAPQDRVPRGPLAAGASRSYFGSPE